MTKFALSKNYINTLNKLYAIQNKHNYHNCRGILSMCNKYEEYITTRNKKYLYETSQIIGSNLFVDSLKIIEKTGIQNDNYEYINKIVDDCIKNNDEIVNVAANCSKIISGINLEFEENDIYKLIDKLNNSIDLILHISNYEHNLRINRFEFFEVLQKNFDRTLLQKYKLDPIVNYMFHIVQTIFVNHFWKHEMSKDDHDIVYDYDRASQDILDSDIHVNIHNLSEKTHDLLLESSRTEYDALFGYKEDLYSFLSAIKDIILNRGTGYINRDQIVCSLHIISKYIQKNLPVLRKTLLLDDKDLNILSQSINGEIEKVKKENERIKKIDINNV